MGFIPFYMAYDKEKVTDMQRKMSWWDEESMLRRDYDYMKSAYPEMAKRIIPYVEEECDRMEYSGSMMFDEYPDLLQVRMMCRRIFAKVKENEKKFQDKMWMEELIQVLVWHEIMKRRGEYRKYRRKFY